MVFFQHPNRKYNLQIWVQYIGPICILAYCIVLHLFARENIERHSRDTEMCNMAGFDQTCPWKTVQA
jgi:hypothetical protein